MKLQKIIDSNFAEEVFGVFFAIVIKGSPVSGDPLSAMERIAISPDDKVRLASAADFNEYRVSFTGFDNKDEYEYEV